MKAVNLIPTEQRGPGRAPAAGAPSSAGDPFSAYAVLGVLALALVAAVLYVTSGNTLGERRAQLEGAKQEARALQSQAAALQAYAEFKILSTSRTDTVRGLAEARFDWDTALADVSRALPGDVYIDSFDGTTSSADGGSSIRGAISAPAIQLTGCTRTQSDVARLMARLRSVRGVTRVSLASSTVPPDTDAAPASPSAEDGETVSEACPAGSPPAFDLVVFFERAPVAAGAAPNLTAASTSAGPTGATGAPAGATGPTGATGAPTANAETTIP